MEGQSDLSLTRLERKRQTQWTNEILEYSSRSERVAGGEYRQLGMDIITVSMTAGSYVSEKNWNRRTINQELVATVLLLLLCFCNA